MKCPKCQRDGNGLLAGQDTGSLEEALIEMECPKCHTDAKEQAKFCGKCGTKLLLACPKCGFENSPGNNFCEECGADGWVEKVEKELAAQF